MSKFDLSQSAPFDAKKQLLFSELPLDVVAPSQYPQPCPFGHYAELMTTGEGGNINRELCFVAEHFPHHDGPVLRLHYHRYHPQPPIYLPLHLLKS